jgi:hypothetical protein
MNHSRGLSGPSGRESSTPSPRGRQAYRGGAEARGGPAAGRPAQRTGRDLLGDHRRAAAGRASPARSTTRLSANALGAPIGLPLIGLLNRTARLRTVMTILLAWVTTLPLGALFGAGAYLALR